LAAPTAADLRGAVGHACLPAFPAIPSDRLVSSRQERLLASKGGEGAMKRFVIREVETLKATSAMYSCGCCCPNICYDETGLVWCSC